MDTKEETKSPYYTRADLALLFGVTYQTIKAWEKREDFPTPLKIGERAFRFNKTEVEQWVTNQGVK